MLRKGSRKDLMTVTFKQGLAGEGDLQILGKERTLETEDRMEDTQQAGMACWSRTGQRGDKEPQAQP